MKSKAYRAILVKDIDDQLLASLKARGKKKVVVGLDVGKESILVAFRWGQHDFERPWKVRSPEEILQFAELLQKLGQGRKMIVAMEPTGTYGDPLRQALERVGITPHRVSPKHASDFAETFDGVPSQHDGKDAAVVAELASQGRCWPWPLGMRSEAEQEMKYRVDWMDAQRRQKMAWCGRVEAMLSRHWPEATRIVRSTSGTLVRVLAEHGGPRGLAAMPNAVSELSKWCRGLIAEETLQLLVKSAQETVGVEMGVWNEEQLKRFAEEIRKCNREFSASHRRLLELAAGHEQIEAMGEVVGLATACVLWVELGDPRDYHCARAYCKAAGLNLSERSSGKWQGKLKISKRGSSRVRRWLYLAALRWLRKEPVSSWYKEQMKTRRGESKPAVVAVMRKLLFVLFQVGGRGEPFDVWKIFDVGPQASSPAA